MPTTTAISRRPTAADLFVDSTALYALLDRDDANHQAAAAVFRGLADRVLLTHSYVIVESAALVQRRLGAGATRDLLEHLLAPMTIVFVDEDLHRAAATALLAARKRKISLVDWTSFEVMRARGMREAFAFDRDFVTQGFRVVP